MKHLYEKYRIEEIISNCTEEMISAMEKFHAIIAGGAITSVFTNAPVNDLDVYFRNQEDMAGFLLAMESTSNIILSYSDKAILFTSNGEQMVQVITFKTFPTIKELFKSFDFTISMGAYDVAKGKFILHKDFLRHNAQRVLMFNKKTSFPIISALRVGKYEERGYNIGKAEFVKIILACMSLNIKTAEQMRNQLGGLYGLNMNKIIPDTMTDFSLKAVLKIFDTIQEKQNDSEYLEMERNGNSIASFKMFVCNILQIKPTVYHFKNNKNKDFYLINGDIDNRISEQEVKELGVTPIELDENKMFDLYKFVKKSIMKTYVVKADEAPPCKYHSFYDANYEYGIAEYCYPKKPTTNFYRGESGLYLTSKANIEDSSYIHSTNSTLILCRVKARDIKTFSGTTIIVEKLLFVSEEKELENAVRNEKPKESLPF